MLKELKILLQKYFGISSPKPTETKKQVILDVLIVMKLPDNMLMAILLIYPLMILMF
jgi:hypothetical protein